MFRARCHGGYSEEGLAFGRLGCGRDSMFVAGRGGGGGPSRYFPSTNPSVWIRNSTQSTSNGIFGLQLLIQSQKALEWDGACDRTCFLTIKYFSGGSDFRGRGQRDEGHNFGGESSLRAAVLTVVLSCGPVFCATFERFFFPPIENQQFYIVRGLV